MYYHVTHSTCSNFPHLHPTTKNYGNHVQLLLCASAIFMNLYLPLYSRTVSKVGGRVPNNDWLAGLNY